ncbi:MAG: transposase [Balneolaceae bacterium]|nr:transposase [Balneolaceae bacterium]
MCCYEKKTKVVLEALKERETIQQIASKYELHPNQITTWKRQFMENTDQAFSDDKSATELKKAESERDELYKQIGQMKVENGWLKKKLS